MFRNRYFWLLISLFFVLKTEAKVTLTSIWGDNMVLQQQAEVTFLRKGYSRKTCICFRFVESSENLCRLWPERTMDTGSSDSGSRRPYTITFSDGEELTLKNILIGEVWFCSGQSNMEMPVKGFRGQPVYGSQPYIVSANPKRPLRLYTVKNNWSTTPKEEGIDGQWKWSIFGRSGRFQCNCLFLRQSVATSFRRPVGLIHCSWSMSKIEHGWTKKPYLIFPK